MPPKGVCSGPDPEDALPSPVPVRSLSKEPPSVRRLLEQCTRPAARDVLALSLLALPFRSMALPAATSPAVDVRHAARFTLEQRAGYRLLTVRNPWRNAKRSFSYALVKRGAPQPADLPAGATVVRVPVQRAVLLSSTYVAAFDMLGLVDRIAGVAKAALIYTPSVTERVTGGAIAEVGTGMAGGVNLEKLFVLQPDLIMTYGTGDPQFDSHAKMREAGFSVAINADYMETTPLGRAEWVRFIAAFFCRDARAEELFRVIEAEYERVAALVRDSVQRPTVFCNIDFNGTWHVPGGRSFTAALLRDAGARYLWEEDTSSGGKPLDVEAVIARARDADVWINPGICRSLRDIESIDERYRLFDAFRAHRVYGNNARISSGGASDFWETGVVNPHLVLSDLIKVLHPELLPRHELLWYRRLGYEREDAL